MLRAFTLPPDPPAGEQHWAAALRPLCNDPGPPAVPSWSLHRRGCLGEQSGRKGEKRF